MKVISYLALCACCLNGVAHADAIVLSQKQKDLLEFAHEVAVEDGHQYPQYLLGIIMQETMAGGVDQFRVAGLENSASERYFGIGQVKLPAAKEVMRRFPYLWKYLDTRTDEELKARLILDDKFNIRVTSKYALMMGMNERPNRAITAYNRGPGGVTKVEDPKSHPYTVAVKAFAARLKNVLWGKSDIQSISDGKRSD